MIRIKPVANKTEIQVLRKYGHRVFAEMSDKLEPIGYFVEYKDGSMPTEDVEGFKPIVRRIDPVAKNAAMVWVADKSAPYLLGTMMHSVAVSCKKLADKPIRRHELVQLIAEDTSVNVTSISPTLSKLTRDGFLKVAGE